MSESGHGDGYAISTLSERLRNVGDGDAVVVIAGGKDGYVGHDGRTGEGWNTQGPPGAA